MKSPPYKRRRAVREGKTTPLATRYWRVSVSLRQRDGRDGRFAHHHHGTHKALEGAHGHAAGAGKHGIVSSAVTGTARNHAIVDGLHQIPVTRKCLFAALRSAVRINHDGAKGVHRVLFGDRRQRFDIVADARSKAIGLGGPARIELNHRLPVPRLRKGGGRRIRIREGSASNRWAIAREAGC